MLLHDFRYAFRMLRSSPLFAAAAAITIGLGIGAATAIFSVADAVLLRPLPYRDPARLVLALHDMTRRGVRDWPFSNADYIDIRNGTRATLEDAAAVFTFQQVMPNRDGEPEETHFAVVSSDFFRVMGGRILAGRDFSEADAQPQLPAPAGATAPPPAPPVALLSYSYWQRRFGGDPSIFGRSITSPNRVIAVGVLAPGFELLFPPKLNVAQEPEVWVCGRFAYDVAQRNNVSLRVVDRLKPGVTLAQAQAEADRVSAEIRRSSVISNTAGVQVRLEPMQQYLSAEVRPALLALIGAAGFLLLIACSNVANLLLVRAGLRERELAVRSALGGSTWRLVRQLFAEALLLAFAGAALGLFLAQTGIRELRAIAPANLPRLEEIRIDPAVLAFTAISALVSAALFGLVPAMRAARPDLAQVLRAAGRSSGLGAAGALRNLVVVAEVALAFVLLAGSGLMFRSFLEVRRVDPGFDAHNLLTFQLLIGRRPGPQPQARAAFLHELQDRLRSIPGVQSASASNFLPFSGPANNNAIRWGLAPALSDPTQYQAVDAQAVLPGYFETMHTRLLAGRTFTDADNAPDRNGVVVDEILAAKAFPHQSAVGQRILARIRGLQPEWVEILGVVAHQHQNSLADPGREQIYFTDGYLSHGVVSRWMVRTTGDPAGYATHIREALAPDAAGRGLVLVQVQPMTALVERAEAPTRFALLLIGVFAVASALLAAVGLYGVLATLVRQRTAEIGVRMALGAAPARIFGMMIGQGLRLSVAGICLGLAAALVLTRVIASLLVGVKPTDPATFAAIAAGFLSVAALACWLPARRASALDPVDALRQE
jgi:predicted permease